MVLDVIHLVILMPFALSAQVQQNVAVTEDMQEMDTPVKVSHIELAMSGEIAIANY